MEESTSFSSRTPFRALNVHEKGSTSIGNQLCHAEEVASFRFRMQIGGPSCPNSGLASLVPI